MTQAVLSTQSPYTFVRHDNAGQTTPDNCEFFSSKLGLEGIIIDIAANSIINEPIILINCSAINNKSINTINIGQNSQVQIIEYLMSDDANSNNQVTTNINCAAGSQLRHCVLHHSNNNDTITQQSATKINQDRDSNVVTNIFSFGGGLNKIQMAIALQGANAHCSTSNLAYTHDSENQDVLLTIDHEHESCTSQTLARGVLKDKSLTNLLGKITVHPGAKKTIADLQIKNLLCSPKAQAINKPELEIYNDDVKCSHGSSTGQIDADALFYMRSRGIGIAEATEMLIAGFIQPVIDSCTIPCITDYVRKVIAER